MVSSYDAFGFKLEATNSVDYLLERARYRMESADASYMVANSSRSLYDSSEPHFILSRDGRYVQADGKKEAAKQLLALLTNEKDFANEGSIV